jgi:ABC-2 type transport system permease protein
VSLLRAFVHRDFRLERSYRLAFFAQMFGVATTLLSAGFLSRIVPGGQDALQPYGSDYFTFVLIGTAALNFFSVGMGSFSSSLGQEQSHGTLEALLVSPNDPRVLLLYGAAWPFLFSTLQMIAYVALGGLLFGAELYPGNLFLAAVAGVMTLVAVSAIGLAVAGVIVVTKRAGGLIALIGAAFALLGGVLYPIAVLPGPLQTLAQLLPMYHGLEAIRLSLVEHPDLAAISRHLAALGAFAAVLVPASLQGFQWAVRRARRAGTLMQH